MEAEYDLLDALDEAPDGYLSFSRAGQLVNRDMRDGQQLRLWLEDRPEYFKVGDTGIWRADTAGFDGEAARDKLAEKLEEWLEERGCAAHLGQHVGPFIQRTLGLRGKGRLREFFEAYADKFVLSGDHVRLADVPGFEGEGPQMELESRLRAWLLDLGRPAHLGHDVGKYVTRTLGLNCKWACGGDKGRLRKFFDLHYYTFILDGDYVELRDYFPEPRPAPAQTRAQAERQQAETDRVDTPVPYSAPPPPAPHAPSACVGKCPPPSELVFTQHADAGAASSLRMQGAVLEVRDEELCVVCLERPLEVGFMHGATCAPLGQGYLCVLIFGTDLRLHRACCRVCADLLTDPRCPVCQQYVERRLMVF